YNRGIANPADAEVFLAADKRLTNDPSLLPGVNEAVARIMRAIHNKETIVVFGDFDADGVTAAALLIQGLKEIGGKAIPYIPHRVEEGHGLNTPALAKLQDQGATLIITVDCGITGTAEADRAQEMGLDLIITDHHEVVGSMPQALAIIDPKLPGSPYPFRELAGVGVAFKLLHALFKATGKENHIDAYLDLVALGTVADLVPLLDENRYLVNRGIQILNQTNRLGIRHMVDRSTLEMGNLDTESISFTLAPRLNAAGRLDHASVSYDILVTDSDEEARQLAELLDMRNVERQNLTREYMALAEELLAPIDPQTPFLMVVDKEFHAGVNGVVAGKLSDKYYRPSIVVEVGKDESMGSARSIPEFNMISALSECSDLFSHFGGHAQAAGFGISNENLDSLSERLIQIAGRELVDVDLHPTIHIDIEVPLASIGKGTFDLIKRLEPCGQANRPPTFLSRGVRVIDSRRVGNGGEHLKFKLSDKGMTWNAIGFGLNHLNEDQPPLIDIVYNLKMNKWRGQESLQLEILDFASTELI
ncbi:MAG: single-stranded-DNA-specific exonuclease RecJ, partial [Chloroflexota bacterium]|nr:single-stranded-DNA-specific exonuclease RecJ [Chloroflexota bacterium]